MHVAMHIFCAVFLAGLASVAPQTSRAQDQYEIVQFQSLTFPGRLYAPLMPPPEDGRPATIFGILRVPAGGARVPAVIVTHGCAGISAAEHFWARRLHEFGFVTFTVNSFAGRDVPNACMGTHELNMASMITDMYRAMALLAAHPRVDPTRIALMGFSFGGRTTLWASHLRFRELYGPASPRFAAYLAFYPAACYIQLADEHRMDNVPIRLFHGTADDWTPIAACREYVARLQRIGKDASLIEYAGAHHAFDNANWPSLKTSLNVLNPSNCRYVERDGKLVEAATGALAGSDAPCVMRGASFGHSPEARQQAAADVENFLNAVFRLK